MAARPLVDTREDLRRLHQAARLAHGLDREPMSPLEAFRALPLVERLAVVAAGVVFAMAVFAVPQLLGLLAAAIGAPR